MKKIIHETSFHYLKKFERVMEKQIQLKSDGQGGAKKVERDVYVDRETTDLKTALKDARKEAEKQGFNDVSLEKVTLEAYEFKFYNPKDLARSESEKGIKPRAKK